MPSNKTETLAQEHMRRVHGDGSECKDGCDLPPIRPQKIYVKPGEKVSVVLPYSEVCMYMGIADREMTVEVLPEYRGAQLYERTIDAQGESLRAFSAPITMGEAGFYHDAEGYYTYRD